MIPAAVTGDMVNDINGTEIMPTMLSPPLAMPTATAAIIASSQDVCDNSTLCPRHHANRALKAFRHGTNPCATI